MEDCEIYYKNAIQNQIYRLPKEFELYVNYLINEKGLSYYDASKELKTIEAYYNVLAMHYNKILFKISPEELTQNCATTENFINKTLTKAEQIRLANYYRWLESKHIISHSINSNLLEESNENIIKNPNPKKINGPEDVKFFKDYERNYAQTTINHKYSLEKCLKGRYTEYTYMIHDNKAGQYILNESGNILEIKRYREV